MIHSEKIEYLLINETVVDPEVSRKGHQILRENVTEVNGTKLWTLTFRQILSEINAKNWNGRTYTDLMGPIKNNPLIQRDLEIDQWMGEFGHPIAEKGQNELVRQLTIYPPNTCWKISDPHMEGNFLVSTNTTLSGSWGDVVRDRAVTGNPPLASTRAIGGCDSRGNVLPGLQLITADCVYRASSKNAVAKADSYQVNNYTTPIGNSMSESAVPIDLKSESFKDFLLTEAVSRDKIAMVCDTLKVDYDSMELTENALRIVQINGNTKNTIVMPISKLVGASHHVLF